MKTYYELLGIHPTAQPEEVKRAFRKEIARYHPDKVQHLGYEFQEIAATRAAALTEAYRILMDPQLRQRYDDSIAEGTAPPPAPPPAEPTPADAPPRPTAAPASAPAAPAEEAGTAPPPDRRFAKEQASSSEFLRRAVMAKLKEAVEAMGGVPTTGTAFDAIFQIKRRKALFRKPEPAVRLVMKLVPRVDAAAVEQSWTPAVRQTTPGETLCLMLLGSALAPARELATAVSQLRRKTRGAGPLVIPVDVRDWEALLPPETPATVRILLERLRQGE